MSCPEKLRAFQNLLDMVLLSRLIQIVAIAPVVKETSFSKKQFQLQPSFVRSDGGEWHVFSYLVNREERDEGFGEKSLSGYNSSCSPQLFNLFHRKAEAVGIVFQDKSTKAYTGLFSD